jgi:hypothetical protein
MFSAPSQRFRQIFALFLFSVEREVSNVLSGVECVTKNTFCYAVLLLQGKSLLRTKAKAQICLGFGLGHWARLFTLFDKT